MTLIEVHTDGGLVGVTAAEARSETAIAIDRFVTPHLIGRDAAAPEQLTRILQDAEILGPPVYCIEIALWDVAGKAAGLPVSTMWGRFADRIPAYCATGGARCGWPAARTTTVCTSSSSCSIAAVTTSSSRTPCYQKACTRSARLRPLPKRRVAWSHRTRGLTA